MKPFCYCSIGAGGKPCINREYCDNNKNRVFEENNNGETNEEEQEISQDGTRTQPED